MSEKDLHLHGEERRLFYVALTRARRETHLVCPVTAPSLFALELLKDNLGIHVGLDISKNRLCPSCKSGRVLVSANNGGSYCSNIPLCDFTAPSCMKCSRAMVYLGGIERFICENHPETRYSPCHVCDWGVLIPKKYHNRRTQRESVFYSCHTWPKTKCTGKRS